VFFTSTGWGVQDMGVAWRSGAPSDHPVPMVLSDVAVPLSCIPSDSGSVIQLDGVCKSYGDTWVLDDVSLSVREGEIVCLIGPSGVGKSTILNMIAGLVSQNCGVVRVQAQPLAYVFQEPRLLPWCDVAGNVQIGLHALRIPKDERLQLTREVLERIGLQASAHLYPSQLSGGMKQRVALARAFVLKPRVLLLDEPFSALDHSLRHSLREYLLELLSWRPCTTLFVTHDLEDAVRLGDRVIVMRGPSGLSAIEHHIDMDRAERSDAFCLSEIEKVRALWAMSEDT